MADAVERLGRIPGVGTVLLDRSDIVRHPLVQAIVDAYESVDLAAERESRERGETTAPGPAGDVPRASHPVQSSTQIPSSPTASE
jgi:phosphate starvation-inducible PhoH-like protein